MKSSHLALCILYIGLSSACGPRQIQFPSDSGAPLSNYSEMYAEVTQSCRGARTLTAELGLSGRAGSQRLRGRLVAGFERPASMRLEAVAPFGPPGFILATRGDRAVLLLPRDERVVQGESADAILGALTGVNLAPADLQAILTGCVLPATKAIAGRLHANGWASIDLEGGATIYLRRSGAWQIQSARRSGWEVEYPMWQGAFPQTVRLRSARDAIAVDMTATLAQVEVNVSVDPAAFTVDVPAGTSPLSLDELRRAGPLGEKP